MARFGGLPGWLAEAANAGLRIEAVCAGNLLLAASGLADGQEITTHPDLTRLLTQYWPRVQVRDERVISVGTGYVSAGGMMAWVDLAIDLVRRRLGDVEARRLARWLHADPLRSSQLPHRELLPRPRLPLDRLAPLLDRLRAEPAALWDVERMAALTCCSTRTLEREFDRVFGLGPRRYLQLLRLNRAQELLVGTRLGVAEVGTAVGWPDAPGFSRAFQRACGMSPGRWREWAGGA